MKKNYQKLMTVTQKLPLSICILVWLFLDLCSTLYPKYLAYLSFFDNVTFEGVRVRSLCTSGFPLMNARLLMCAWAISFALILYTFFNSLRDQKFYTDFIARSKVMEEENMVGHYSSKRFKYYYITAIFIMLLYSYYYYMLAGYFGDNSCSKFLADRTLLIQGAVIIATGNLFGWVLAIAISKVKQYLK